MGIDDDDDDDGSFGRSLGIIETRKKGSKENLEPGDDTKLSRKKRNNNKKLK